MLLLARLVPRTAKGIAVTASLVILVGLVGWQGLRMLWNYGYSRGTRTGLVQKISYKGSPLCKYWSVELAPVGTGGLMVTGQPPQEMTVDGPSENNPIVEKLRKAEAKGGRTTVEYRQDKGKWWACSLSEYYITNVLEIQ
jgi:hypothetical protein